MHLSVFGLSISSSWGNGHATQWRGLCRALGERGHRVTFFERDVAYYAAHRDQPSPAGCDLVLYRDFAEARDRAEPILARCDAAFATPSCPDGPAAAALVVESAVPLRVFYDLDAPVTLDR